MRKLLVLVVAVGIARVALCDGDDPTKRVRVATFNIENFPKSERQVSGAFAAIAALDVAAVGVQEITAPKTFGAAAQEHLGAAWRFAYPRPSPPQRVGVLYDSDVLELLSTRSHRGVQVYTGAKPAFEARLRRRDTDDVVRLIVVHLKATGEGRPIRARQHRALRQIVRDARSSDEQVVVVGDFNATEPADRDDLAELARAADMAWASEGLACTAYWNRNDGCRGTALDHVLTTAPPADIAARGPCEDIGCDPGQQCPVFHREVSDHCPVSFGL